MIRHQNGAGRNRALEIPFALSTRTVPTLRCLGFSLDRAPKTDGLSVFEGI